MFKLQGNIFERQEAESKNFYSRPQQKSFLGSYNRPGQTEITLSLAGIITPGKTEITYSPEDVMFFKICFLQQKVEGKQKTMILDKSQLICYFYGCLATHKKSVSNFISSLKY